LTTLPANKRAFFLALVLFLFQTVSAQYITTIAGNGDHACYKDNDLAICTPFFAPSGICIAANGDIFLTCGNSIKKINAITGVVTRIAGTDSPGSSGDGGPAINALFQFTKAIVMDAAGNLYIAEYTGNRIRKITMSTGIITTIAGTGTAGYSGDGGLAVNAKINQPWELSIDANSNLYIADFLNSRIRKVDAITGIITTVAGNGTNSASTGDGGLATTAAIPYPNSICHDNNGNLYIAESYGNVTGRIRKIDAATGIITTIAGSNLYLHGGDGGLAINADLLEPSGVHVDPAGNVYISEYVGSRIRKINAVTGIITTIAGTGINAFGGDGGLAVNASLYYPLGLSMDLNGNLYICSSQDARVRKVFMTATSPPDMSPAISITSPTTFVCGNNPITFTATTSNLGLNPTYTWKKNGITVVTNTLTYTGSGLLTGDIITCTVTSNLCAGASTINSNSIILTGGTTGTLDIGIAASATSICLGQNVVFTATPSNAGTNPSYQWKKNGNDIGTNSSIYNSSNLVNGDIINCVLTADPAFPCASNTTAISANITMAVNMSPVPSVIISASDNGVCPGVPITFSANVQNSLNNNFEWKLNNLSVGSNSSLYTNNNFSNSDEVICIITPINNCSAQPITSNSINISVKSLPAIQITPLNITVSPGSQIQLKATTTGPISTFSWTPSSALNNSTSLSPLTIPLQKETAFTFTIVTDDNCKLSSSTLIKVEQKLLMPSGFTPNNNGINDVFRIPPNVTLNLKEFAIFDRWGSKVFSTSDISKGWDGNVNGKKREPGVYIYIVEGYIQDKYISLKGTFTLIR